MEGPIEGGFYPMYLNKNNINKCHGQVASFGVNTFLDMWHARLGHPLAAVTKQVIDFFKLPL